MGRIIFIVLVAMLVRWLVTLATRKRCPECANRVPRKARVCYQCKHSFAKDMVARQQAKDERAKNYRVLTKVRCMFLAGVFVVASVPAGIWYVERVADVFQEYQFPMYLAQFDKEFGNVVSPILRGNKTRLALDAFFDGIGIESDNNYDIPGVAYNVFISSSGKLFAAMGHVIYPTKLIPRYYLIAPADSRFWPEKYQEESDKGFNWMISSSGEYRQSLKNFGLDLKAITAEGYVSRYQTWGWAGIRFGVYVGMFFFLLLLLEFQQRPARIERDLDGEGAQSPIPQDSTAS